MQVMISEREAVEIFETSLDDCNPVVKIGYLVFHPSDILRKLDPVAYREDFINFCDSLVDSDIFVEDYTDDQMEAEVE
jgi:hypothetical protein